MRRHTASGGSEAGALSSVISTGAVQGGSSRGAWRMDVLAGGAPAGETVLDLSALNFRVTWGDLKKKTKTNTNDQPNPKQLSQDPWGKPLAPVFMKAPWVNLVSSWVANPCLGDHGVGSGCKIQERQEQGCTLCGEKPGLARAQDSCKCRVSLTLHRVVYN